MLQAEPSIIYDGRFEQMILAPSTILDIAHELIEQKPLNAIDKPLPTLNLTL